MATINFCRAAAILWLASGLSINYACTEHLNRNNFFKWPTQKATTFFKIWQALMTATILEFNSLIDLISIIINWKFNQFTVTIQYFWLNFSPFLRFLTLVKLLTVRVITPTVTCRWYVIIFLFFLLLLLLLMGNDLEILLLQLSTTLVQLSWPLKRDKPLIEPAQSWWECMKVDESWWSNESESCDSHPCLIRPLASMTTSNY